MKHSPIVRPRGETVTRMEQIFPTFHMTPDRTQQRTTGGARPPKASGAEALPPKALAAPSAPLSACGALMRLKRLSLRLLRPLAAAPRSLALPMESPPPCPQLPLASPPSCSADTGLTSMDAPNAF